MPPSFESQEGSARGPTSCCSCQHGERRRVEASRCECCCSWLWRVVVVVRVEVGLQDPVVQAEERVGVGGDPSVQAEMGLRVLSWMRVVEREPLEVGWMRVVEREPLEVGWVRVVEREPLEVEWEWVWVAPPAQV